MAQRTFIAQHGTTRQEFTLPAALTITATRAAVATRLGLVGRVRLITAGRLLNDGETLGAAVPEDGAFVHVVGAAAAPASAPAPPSAPIVPPSPAEAGGGDGGDAVAVDVGEAASANAAAPLPAAPRTGFDRLLDMGLSQDDVDLFRGLYLPDVTRELNDSTPLAPGEAEMTRLRRMEDRWMAEQGADSDFMLNLRPMLLARHAAAFSRIAAMQRALREAEGGDGVARRPARGGGAPDGNGDADEGDDDDEAAAPERRQQPSAAGELSAFLCGFMAAVVVGPFMLIWLFQPAFSGKFRAGIIIGVISRLLLDFTLPSLYGSASASASGSGSNTSGSGGDSGGTVTDGVVTGNSGPFAVPWTRWRPVFRADDTT